jgi:hypothetical protein
MARYRGYRRYVSSKQRQPSLCQLTMARGRWARGCTCCKTAIDVGSLRERGNHLAPRSRGPSAQGFFPGRCKLVPPIAAAEMHATTATPAATPTYALVQHKTAKTHRDLCFKKTDSVNSRMAFFSAPWRCHCGAGIVAKRAWWSESNQHRKKSAFDFVDRRRR